MTICYRNTNDRTFSWLLLLVLLFTAGCNATRHVEDGKYLLQSNTLKLKSDQAITRRGELKDQLSSLIIQKPNTKAIGMPYKVWLYNGRYRKYTRDSTARNFQVRSKTIELPVIYDSTLERRSVINLKSYLFNRGYFYASVEDTVVFSGKRASVSYKVNTGMQYLVGTTRLVIKDSTILKLVAQSMNASVYKEGVPFSNTMAEEERSRIVNMLRNSGYFRFTQENIRFEVDTVNKQFLRDPENPFESAINFIALQRSNRKPTIDVEIIVEDADKEDAFRQFKIGRVRIFPDFKDRADFRDTSLIERSVDSVVFKYHDYYVRAGVLMSHVFLKKGELYSQENYDRTIVKLNELGLFQYVQVYVTEDSTLPAETSLRCTILLTPADRYDVGTNLEVSNGTTYMLGSGISATFRNRNLLRGANQLSLSISAGVEMSYNDLENRGFLKNFNVISKNAGIYGAITFPKFIAPINPERLKKFNQPRTILGVGYNLLERQDYFTMHNVVANYTYTWKPNDAVTWDVSPAFVSVFRLPVISDSFRNRLADNEVLENSYRENFIEGENIAFTFSNVNSPRASRRYSYVKVSLEEAGGLLTGLNAINKSVNFNFSQYVKVDVDARHYLRRPHSTLAMRLFAGIGMPYGASTTLPYVKQYFAGGAYSIRGWRVRQLGPGSYYDSSQATNINPIDRVGDIKFEGNIEYRFDMIQLFSGAIHLNGALFVDAGNIWLARASEKYPGGELSLNKFGNDLAVSSGAGVRVDIGGLFILRFDGAFPTKKPYVSENGGWVWKDITLNNMVLNIAIGYPF